MKSRCSDCEPRKFRRRNFRVTILYDIMHPILHIWPKLRMYPYIKILHWHLYIELCFWGWNILEDRSVEIQVFGIHPGNRWWSHAYRARWVSGFELQKMSYLFESTEMCLHFQLLHSNMQLVNLLHSAAHDTGRAAKQHHNGSIEGPACPDIKNKKKVWTKLCGFEIFDPFWLVMSAIRFFTYRQPCHGLPGLARDLSLSSDEIVPVEGQEKAKPLKKPYDNSCTMTSACQSSYVSQHIFFCQRFMVPTIFIGHVE